MPIIYHITTVGDWNSALISGVYVTHSLHTEGFIHCSTSEQLTATADRLFRGARDLVLLCIETDNLGVPVRYENLEGGAQHFPHVYGAIETGSITAAYAFAPGADGRFELPAAWAHEVAGAGMEK